MPKSITDEKDESKLFSNVTRLSEKRGVAHLETN